jgi:hypothetical protein
MYYTGNTPHSAIGNIGLSEDSRRAQNYATRYLKIGFDNFNFYCKIYNSFSTGLPFSCSFTNPTMVVQDVIFHYFLLLIKRGNKEINVKVSVSLSGVAVFLIFLGC